MTIGYSEIFFFAKDFHSERPAKTASNVRMFYCSVKVDF